MADAPRGDQAKRCSAYNAALDQEEASAITYAHSIAELERWLPLGAV